jgi:hypothetical protein
MWADIERNFSNQNEVHLCIKHVIGTVDIEPTLLRMVLRFMERTLRA